VSIWVVILFGRKVTGCAVRIEVILPDLTAMQRGGEAEFLDTHRTKFT
jgi:hypothetical protein